MATESFEDLYNELLKERERCIDALNSTRIVYRDDMKKHIKTIIFTGIAWISIFMCILFRYKFDDEFSERAVVLMFVLPAAVLFLVLFLVFLRSICHLFFMTRKRNIVFGIIRIRRGIRDEMERLELELAVIEKDLKEFSDLIDDE